MRILIIHILIYIILSINGFANTDDREVSVFNYPWYDLNPYKQEGIFIHS